MPNRSKIIHALTMSFFGWFRKKEVIVFADTFKPISALESSALVGLSSAVFITVLPVVSGSVGTWLACQTSGCASLASSAGGFAAGSSASATGVGIGSYLYYRRYKTWTIKNVGKYVINEGRLQKVIPLAFIVSSPITLSPISMILIANAYSFGSSYVRTKNLINSSKDTV